MRGMGGGASGAGLLARAGRALPPTLRSLAGRLYTARGRVAVRERRSALLLRSTSAVRIGPRSGSPSALGGVPLYRAHARLRVLRV